MRTVRHTLTPAVVLGCVLTLSACGSSSDATSKTAAAPTTASAGSQSPAAYNATDVRFTQGMLPHHMQAVRNAMIEVAMGSDSKVKAIAQHILQEQNKEIITMRGFLQKFGAAEKPAPADQQAVWDANTAELRSAATPTARDVIFLTNMVPHHSAAIPMAQNEIALGSYAPAKELAMNIKTTQRMEIKTMNMMIRARTAAASATTSGK
jgi:uncharacterized protein (DUF305 family)